MIESPRSAPFFASPIHLESPVLKTLSKLFAVVVFIGLIALTIAVGFGAIAGDPWSSEPLLRSLRFLGFGFMAAGMALWIVRVRNKAGETSLNGLMGLLTGFGLFGVILGVLAPTSAATDVFHWGGLGLSLAALIVGFLAMVLAPAYETPLTISWPEGGEPDNQTESGSEHSAH